MGGDSSMALLGAVVGAALAIPTGGLSAAAVTPMLAGAGLGAVGGLAAGGVMDGLGSGLSGSTTADSGDQYASLLSEASNQQSETQTQIEQLQASNLEMQNALLAEQMAYNEELQAEADAEEAEAEEKKKRRLAAMQSGGLGSLIKTSGTGASGAATVKKKTLGGA